MIDQYMIIDCNHGKLRHDISQNHELFLSVIYSHSIQFYTIVNRIQTFID